MRRLRLDERQKNSQRYNTDIEAKGDHESMKAFKARVREKTKNSLLEVVPKMLPTNIRRKEKLKARSKLKKEKKLMKTHGGAFKKDDEVSMSIFISIDTEHRYFLFFCTRYLPFLIYANAFREVCGSFFVLN